MSKIKWALRFCLYILMVNLYPPALIMTVLFAHFAYLGIGQSTHSEIAANIAMVVIGLLPSACVAGAVMAPDEAAEKRGRI